MISLINKYVLLGLIITLASYGVATETAFACLHKDVAELSVDDLLPASLCFMERLKCSTFGNSLCDRSSSDSELKYDSIEEKKQILFDSAAKLSYQLQLLNPSFSINSNSVELCDSESVVAEDLYECKSDSGNALCDYYGKELSVFIAVINSIKSENGQINDCLARILRKSISYFDCVFSRYMICDVEKLDSSEDHIRVRRSVSTFNITYGAIGIVAGIALISAIIYAIYALFISSPSNDNVSEVSDLELMERRQPPPVMRMNSQRSGPSRQYSTRPESPGIVSDVEERMEDQAAANERKEKFKKAGKFLGKAAVKGAANRLTQEGAPLQKFSPDQIERAAEFAENAVKTGIAIANTEKGSEERRELVEGAAKDLLKAGARVAVRSMGQDGGYLENMDNDQMDRMANAAMFAAKSTAAAVRRSDSRAGSDYNDRQKRSAPQPPLRSDSRPGNNYDNRGYDPNPPMDHRGYDPNPPVDYDYGRNPGPQVYPKPPMRFSYTAPNNFY